MREREREREWEGERERERERGRERGLLVGYLDFGFDSCIVFFHYCEVRCSVEILQLFLVD